MLAEYEAISAERQALTNNNPQQPWPFTRKEGDVRCVAHVINLAVQAALKTLKAVPLEQVESYRVEVGSAKLPLALVSYIIFYCFI